MSDYIDFHNKNILFQKVIRSIIFLSLKLPKNIYCLFWNSIFYLIGNSVRIKKTKNDTFLISDQSQSIEIVYKKRFEFYMQNIETRLEHLTFEYMLSQVEFYQNDVIIDCGANIGELYLSILNQSNNLLLNYYGFEPVPNDFYTMARNTNNLVLEPLALSSNDSEKKFFLRPNTADSSFEPTSGNRSINVKCVTIDQYFKDIKRIKLLKLEAEGYEFDVLTGAKKSLEKIKYITADLGFELSNNTESSFDDVNKFLLQNDFELIDSTKRNTYLYKNKNYEFD